MLLVIVMRGWELKGGRKGIMTSMMSMISGNLHRFVD